MESRKKLVGVGFQQYMPYILSNGEFNPRTAQNTPGLIFETAKDPFDPKSLVYLVFKKYPLNNFSTCNSSRSYSNEDIFEPEEKPFYFLNILMKAKIKIESRFKNTHGPTNKEALDRLDTYLINKDFLSKIGKDNTCTICQDEFKLGQTCTMMPCEHHYHEKCLKIWLKQENCCPLCRYKLPTDFSS